MQLFSIATLAIVSFVSSSRAQQKTPPRSAQAVPSQPAAFVEEEPEDVYFRCHGYYERTPQLCNKFNFISSEEVSNRNFILGVIVY
jgi:hypothetical protein